MLQHDEQGYLHSDQLPLPIIDDLGLLSACLRQRLEQLAKEPQQKKRMSNQSLEKVIVAVCKGHYLTLQALAELLNRKPQALRNNYLTPMVRAKVLSLAFPATPTHERQAYCSTHAMPEILGPVVSA